jgi:hypothetical protein
VQSDGLLKSFYLETYESPSRSSVVVDFLLPEGSAVITKFLDPSNGFVSFLQSKYWFSSLQLCIRPLAQLRFCRSEMSSKKKR